MSDPYEREAAQAAIQTLQRELARVTEQRDKVAAICRQLIEAGNKALVELKYKQP